MCQASCRNRHVIMVPICGMGVGRGGTLLYVHSKNLCKTALFQCDTALAKHISHSVAPRFAYVTPPEEVR